MRPTIRAARLIACGLLAAAIGGCGKSATDPDPPQQSTTITVTGSGVNPRNIIVPLGAQVTFVNHDTAPHEMSSDPHPEHTDCPEFSPLGRLNPNQSRQTANLVTGRVCGFHDHLNPFNNALKGSVTIQ